MIGAGETLPAVAPEEEAVILEDRPTGIRRRCDR